jgi:hypothetical protein
MGGALAAILLTACGDPTGSGPTTSSFAPSSSRAPAQGQVPASVEWNEVARDVVARNRSSVFVAFRTYATVSVAQLAAVQAAERASSHRDHVSSRAAVAAASAVALSYVYPAESDALEALVRRQVASSTWLERGRVDAALGEARGRAAGAAAVARARTDRFFDPWTGTLPTGPVLHCPTRCPASLIRHASVLSPPGTVSGVNRPASKR